MKKILTVLVFLLTFFVLSFTFLVTLALAFPSAEYAALLFLGGVFTSLAVSIFAAKQFSKNYGKQPRKAKEVKNAKASPTTPPFKIPVTPKGRDDLASRLLTDAEISASAASTADSLWLFLKEWDEMMEAMEKLTWLEGKTKAIKGSPSVRLVRLKSEFQWKLRDAIERSKDTAITDIKGVYRNNKIQRCQMFCDSIEAAANRFSQETREFAEKAVRDVRKAAGISDVPKALDGSVLASSFAKYGGIDAEVLGIDLMDGSAFENWCADLLRKIGYSDVTITAGSGDQGVDILAQKEGIKYAIQCKCYSSDLGNTPIQEVHSGKALYHCQVGAVMTNRHFTSGGQALAEATGTLLWDRDWLITELEKLKSTATI